MNTLKSINRSLSILLANWDQIQAEDALMEDSVQGFLLNWIANWKAYFYVSKKEDLDRQVKRLDDRLKLFVKEGQRIFEEGWITPPEEELSQSSSSEMIMDAIGRLTEGVEVEE